MYDREINSKDTVTLAPSGWTYKRTFVLYDHQSDSLWFPNDDGLVAIEGKKKGQKLEIYPSEQTSLWKWLRIHPTSKVLIE